MAAKLKMSFAKYNGNDTAGISLTTATSAAFEMGDVITVTGLDLAKKKATSIAAKAGASSTLDTSADMIIAEPVASGAKYFVAYVLKGSDTFVVDQEYSA